MHFVFKNSVYHTSGAQEIPGGRGVDFAAMAKGAGYRSTCAIRELDELRRRLPALLRDDGPLLVELETTLADSTPMRKAMITFGISPVPSHTRSKGAMAVLGIDCTAARSG